MWRGCQRSVLRIKRGRWQPCHMKENHFPQPRRSGILPDPQSPRGDMYIGDGPNSNGGHVYRNGRYHKFKAPEGRHVYRRLSRLSRFIGDLSGKQHVYRKFLSLQRSDMFIEGRIRLTPALHRSAMCIAELSNRNLKPQRGDMYIEMSKSHNPKPQRGDM